MSLLLIMLITGTAGLAVGSLLIWLLLKGRIDVLRTQLQAGDQHAVRLQQEINDTRTLLSEARQQVSQLQVDQSRIETHLQDEQRNAEEKLKLLELSREKFTQEFEYLANRIFEDKSEKFVKQNREHLNTLLSPFKNQLSDFRKRIDEVHSTETKERASLLTEVKHLRELNEQVSQDTINLTKALKGDTKQQGNWGELILTRILEQSGLQEGREYESQVHLKNRFGGTESRYPDVVVHLPEDKDVVIDAKVSLTAYEKYCSVESDDAREQAQRAHVQSVRKHMQLLSEKRYEDLDGINTLDVVIMCIPVEPAFITAVAKEPALYEEGFKKHIVLVGPSTLLLTLRIIAAIWRQEYQNRNALDIADRGQRLYEKFAGFVENLEAVGKAIDNAQKCYSDAHKQLCSGSGNLVGQAQKLHALGVKARKQLPKTLVEQSQTTLPDQTDPSHMKSFNKAADDLP